MDFWLVYRTILTMHAPRGLVPCARRAVLPGPSRSPLRHSDPWSASGLVGEPPASLARRDLLFRIVFSGIFAGLLLRLSLILPAGVIGKPILQAMQSMQQGATFCAFLRRLTCCCR